MSTPSSLPWHVGPLYKSDIESSAGRVAECGRTQSPRAIADAALIVHRVNAHDELVAALKAIVEMYGPSSDYEHKAQAAWERCEAALAKAEDPPR